MTILRNSSIVAGDDFVEENYLPIHCLVFNVEALKG
jgi:hypothetical protein